MLSHVVCTNIKKGKSKKRKEKSNCIKCYILPLCFSHDPWSILIMLHYRKYEIKLRGVLTIDSCSRKSSTF